MKLLRIRRALRKIRGHLRHFGHKLRRVLARLICVFLLLFSLWLFIPPSELSQKSQNVQTISAVLFWAVAGPIRAEWSTLTEDQWTHLRQLDPSLEVLREPQRLISILRNYATDAPGSDGHWEMRKEVTQALIDLQAEKFGIQSNPVLGSGFPGGPAVSVLMREHNPNEIHVLVEPNDADDDTVDCPEEEIDFDNNGRLVRRYIRRGSSRL